MAAATAAATAANVSSVTNAGPAQQQSASVPRRKTRLGLSLSERIKVIEARKMGKSMRQLAAQFGCGKTQILNTLAQRERYTREWEVSGRNNPSIGARKRFRHTRNEQINRSVHEWYKEQVANGIRVTGPMLQRQARLYACNLGIVNFAASNGWLANFRRFYNIVSCSSHPKKILPHTQLSMRQEGGNNQEGPIISSVYTFDNDNDEFVQVPCQELNRRSAELSGRLVLERDPLEVNSYHQSATPNVSEEVIIIKSEPASDDEEQVNASAVNLNQHGSVMCPMPTSSLFLSIPNIGIHSSEKEGFSSQPGVLSSRPTILESPLSSSSSSSSIMNHRKRRLLQADHADGSYTSFRLAKPNNSGRDERRIPKLEPLTPWRVHMAEFVNLARSKGLVALTAKDDCGNEWVDIREAMATYRVPKYGYPTHLSRLIVDCSLQFFIEVLGHCVRKGSLLCKNAPNTLDYSEAASILSALGGGNVVCSGVDTVPYWDSSLHMRTIQEISNAEHKYVTQPDNRYRSLECSLWIDRRMGPSCSACKAAKFADYSVSPIDLRRSTSRS